MTLRFRSDSLAHLL